MGLTDIGLRGGYDRARIGNARGKYAGSRSASQFRSTRTMAGERKRGGKYRAFGSLGHARAPGRASDPIHEDLVAIANVIHVPASDLEIARVQLYSAPVVKSTAIELDFTYSEMEDYNCYH
jgi:hypothetical protein